MYGDQPTHSTPAMRRTTLACRSPHPDPALRGLPDELLDPRAESVHGPGAPMGRNGGRVPNPVHDIPPRPQPRRPTTTTQANPRPWSKHSGGARLVPYGWIHPYGWIDSLRIATVCAVCVLLYRTIPLDDDCGEVRTSVDAQVASDDD